LSLEVLECRLALSNIPLNANTWTNLGPSPIGSFANGRVMAIAPDPTDANVIYLGASSGGVWKSTNAGTSWVPLTDNQPVLTTGSLAIDPTNHLTVYAGTGDWSTAPGMGVLKTIDGGSTWTLLGQSTFNGKSITDIVIDPTNTNHLYLSAISGGVYQSFNGGTTWANIFSSDSFFSLVMAANNPQVLYGSSNQAGGVWKTINGGSTWTQLSAAPHGGSVGATFLAISATNPNELFATYWNDGTGSSNAYRTLDGGTTWTSMNLQAYGGMSNVIISPTNANLGFMGSTDPFLETTDGGNTWTNLHSLHVDHHGIAFDANGSLLEGNDGGIYRLTNPNPQSPQWTSLNGSTLSVAQIIGIATNPYNRNFAVVGTQDNSTVEFAGNIHWANDVIGGDGGWTAIDQSNPNTMYGETQGLNLQRSDDNGVTWKGIMTGINLNDPANFFVFYTMDPSNSSRLVYGTNRVYETTNKGANWTAISAPNTNGWNSTRNIQALTIDPNHPNTVYAVAGGTIFVTTNDGGAWSQLAAPGGLTDSFQQVLVDPTNSSSLYIVRNVSGGGQVFHSNSGGTSWTNITGNLPTNGTHAVAYDPRSGTIFVGDFTGVWASTNGGASWSRYKTGLPNVFVNGLVLNPRLNELVADSYGRGMWAITLTTTSDLPSGWSGADIGSPRYAGDDYFDGTTWTVSGGGADIGSTSDQFNFVSQSVAGDAVAFAKITSLVNTNSSAKAGVMFRNSTAANAMFVDVVATPGNGVTMQWRTSAGASASSMQVGGVPAPSASSPVWVKLVRSTNNFTGWYSTDGTNWQQVGSAVTVNMANTATVGLAVTSRNNNLIGGATLTDVGIVTTQVTNNSDSGTGSLRQALLNAATIPGPPQMIQFALPAGSQTISLLSPLPAIAQPLVLTLDSTQHVTIAFGKTWSNNSSLSLSGGGTLTLGAAIDGTGNLTIAAGSALTINHIVQNTLAIGGAAGNAATVIIAPSDASGNPLTVAGSTVGNSGVGSPPASSSSAASASDAKSLISSTTSAGSVLPQSQFVEATNGNSLVSWVSMVPIKASPILHSQKSSSERFGASILFELAVDRSSMDSILRPSSVTTLFNDMTDLDWLLSPSTSLPSALDASVFSAADDLLEGAFPRTSSWAS
jgi:hypothetical protein